MKNPFVMMALMAAAMSEAFKENKYRDAGVSLPGGRSKSRFRGKEQPAGTKLIKRFYKAKHGQKADSAEEARAWYAEYMRGMDADARRREEQKKLDRIARNHPWLAHRLPKAA